MLTQSQEKYQEVLEVAETLYRQNPDWVTFFREVLGVEGTVRKAFPTFDELTAFEQSPQFDKIQKLLVRLREKRSNVDVETEPTRVITVRLPKSMHEYLRTEAHDLRTSMNKLCISKLLQVIGEDMIPNERTGGGERLAGAAVVAGDRRPSSGDPDAVRSDAGADARHDGVVVRPVATSRSRRRRSSRCKPGCSRRPSAGGVLLDGRVFQRSRPREGAAFLLHRDRSGTRTDAVAWPRTVSAAVAIVLSRLHMPKRSKASRLRIVV